MKVIAKIFMLVVIIMYIMLMIGIAFILTTEEVVIKNKETESSNRPGIINEDETTESILLETTIPNIDDREDEFVKKINEIQNVKGSCDWFIEYKKICAKYNDVIKPPSIYDEFTEDEINILFRVVQAEIGDYSFENKCNVASVILNRINHERFPNTMFEVLTANQFETISNGTIYEVTIDEEVILACEYVYMIGVTTDCLFFDSNGALASNYKHIFNDGAHNFYSIEEK